MIADELRQIARLLRPLAAGVPMKPEGVRSMVAVLLDLADRVEALECHAVVEPSPVAALERECGVRLTPEQRRAVEDVACRLDRLARGDPS